MTLKRFAALPAIAALAVAGFTASPAEAAGPVGQFTLTITDASTGMVKSQVTLTCLPTGGTHPHAQPACDDLVAANGQIAWIPPQAGSFCIAVYQPVYATATGTWAGAPDNYRMLFSNACAANVLTGGHVFYF